MNCIDINRYRHFDEILFEMIHNIKEGDLKISKMLSGTYYKCLNRLLKNSMGISPKKTINILQFNYATSLFQHYKNYTEIAYIAGYCDQSHFIKNFNAFSGTCPKIYAKISDKMFKFNQDVINSQYI